MFTLPRGGPSSESSLDVSLPFSSMSSSKQVIVSSSDSDIKYNGNWTFIPEDDDHDAFHWTGTPNSGFTYEFVGTDISIVGALNPTDLKRYTPLVASFTIDNQDAVTNIAWNTTELVETVLWFQSGTLSSGQHQISVNVKSCSNFNTFIFFAIYYVPSETPPATVTLTSLISAPTASTTHMSNQDTVSGDVSKTDAPLGAIIGGVVGGLIFVGLVSLGLWYYFTNRRTRQANFFKLTNVDEWIDEEEDGKFPPRSPPPPPPVPFDLQSSRASSLYDPPPPSLTYHGAAGEGRSGSDAASSVLTGGSQRTTGTVLAVTNPTDVTSVTVVSRSKAEEAGLLYSSSEEATYHRDSGLRFGSAGEPSGSSHLPLTDVPPSYSEA
ncbi:hypothetical protein QCA50_003667 [Cerrena zonata]|uniref:Uncharacterized protein n=1 Tax=Cerrena zonata TaxID=2478898 RepID=A0AAW0GMV8_9APHY